MSKTYSKHEHTHVIVNHPDKNTVHWSDGWGGPMEIVLHTSTHVWVAGCFSMHSHPDVVQVGIGGPAPTAYDEDGNCVLAVPAAWCEFYSTVDADQIAQAMDADERLLSYAR